MWIFRLSSCHSTRVLLDHASTFSQLPNQQQIADYEKEKEKEAAAYQRKKLLLNSHFDWQDRQLQQREQLVQQKEQQLQQKYQQFQQREQETQQREYDLNAKVMVWEPFLPFVEELTKIGLLPTDLKMWAHSRKKIEQMEKVDSETASILLTQRFVESLQLGDIEQRLAMGQTALKMQEMIMLQKQMEIFRERNGGANGSNSSLNQNLQITQPAQQPTTTIQPQYQTISPQQVEAVQNLLRRNPDQSMREYLLKNMGVQAR